SGFQHAPGSLLAAKESRLQVYRMNEVPVGFGHLQRMRAGDPPRLVHQAIDPSKMSSDILKQLLDFSHTLQIGLENSGVGALRRRGPRLIGRPVVMNRDSCALPRQPQRDSPPDTFSGSGDEDDLA